MPHREFRIGAPTRYRVGTCRHLTFPRRNIDRSVAGVAHRKNSPLLAPLSASVLRRVVRTAADGHSHDPRDDLRDVFSSFEIFRSVCVTSARERLSLPPSRARVRKRFARFPSLDERSTAFVRCRNVVRSEIR